MHPIGMGLRPLSARTEANHNAKNPLRTILTVYWVDAPVALSSLFGRPWPSKMS